MTFSVRGLLYLVAFLAVVAVAVNTRASAVAPWFGILGVAALVLVDGVLTFWPAAGRRQPKLPDY